MSTRPIAIALVSAALGTGVAAAGPGDEPYDGAVFAGPTGGHTGNVVSNPAGLLRINPGLHLFIDGVARLEQLGVDRTVIDAGGAAHPGPKVDGTTFGAGGSLGAIISSPGGMVAFAFALPPPEETLPGQAALAYHTLGSRSRRTDWAAIAAGYHFGRFQIGLAAGLSTRRTVLRFERDTALDAGRDPSRGVVSDCDGAPCGVENPLAAEAWTVDVDHPLLSVDNLVLTGGLMVSLPASTVLGVSWQRPWRTGRYELTGTVDVAGAPRDGGVLHHGEASVFIGQPEVWRIGTRTDVTRRWQAVTELRWRRLSEIGAYDLRTYGGDLAAGGVPEFDPQARGLHDAIAFEAGVEEAELGQPVRFGARLGADSGAVGGERISPRAPWSSAITGAAGVQLRLASHWIVQVGYRAELQLPTTAGPSAFDPVATLDCVDSGYQHDLPACATVRDGYGAPSAAGSYSRLTHTGWLGLRIEVR